MYGAVPEGAVSPERLVSRYVARMPEDRYPTLKGKFAGLRKYRVGDYRVIFAIAGREVLVLRIGNRRDVYR